MINQLKQNLLLMVRLTASDSLLCPPKEQVQQELPRNITVTTPQPPPRYTFECQNTIGKTIKKAGSIIFSKIDGEWHILLGISNFSDCSSTEIPFLTVSAGGKKQEESVLDTVIRETREETGNTINLSVEEIKKYPFLLFQSGQFFPALAIIVIEEKDIEHLNTATINHYKHSKNKSEKEIKGYVSIPLTKLESTKRIPIDGVNHYGWEVDEELRGCRDQIEEVLQRCKEEAHTEIKAIILSGTYGLGIRCNLYEIKRILNNCYSEED